MAECPIIVTSNVNNQVIFCLIKQCNIVLITCQQSLIVYKTVYTNKSIQNSPVLEVALKGVRKENSLKLMFETIPVWR